MDFNCLRKSFSCALFAVMAILPAGQVSAQDMRHNPCVADVAMLCNGIEPGEGRITRCLKQRENELSQPCRDYMVGLRDKGRQFAKGCKTDVQKLCRNVKPGEGRLLRCLEEHQSELSDTCRPYIVLR